MREGPGARERVYESVLKTLEVLDWRFVCETPGAMFVIVAAGVLCFLRGSVFGTEDGAWTSGVGEAEELTVA